MSRSVSRSSECLLRVAIAALCGGECVCRVGERVEARVRQYSHLLVVYGGFRPQGVVLRREDGNRRERSRCEVRQMHCGGWWGGVRVRNGQNHCWGAVRAVYLWLRCVCGESSACGVDDGVGHIVDCGGGRYRRRTVTRRSEGRRREGIHVALKGLWRRGRPRARACDLSGGVLQLLRQRCKACRAEKRGVGGRGGSCGYGGCVGRCCGRVWGGEGRESVHGGGDGGCRRGGWSLGR